ncbi:hypothetical protein NPIL_576311 [Nephila pilipes]|uniref:Uncharacterized protein n=1 Tax=Nephila pilipes TaxID=299642 RepID=A0A8X6NFJ6_NEPPI|nr:hypothetical protein NPIL_576311 [Nephila pilipes]
MGKSDHNQPQTWGLSQSLLECLGINRMTSVHAGWMSLAFNGLEFQGSPGCVQLLYTGTFGREFVFWDSLPYLCFVSVLGVAFWETKLASWTGAAQFW